MMWDPYADFESATLSNGLSVHVLHWPDRAGVHFRFGIHSGGRHDPVGKEGAAHYMEHLVSCNGGSSPEELKEFFDRNTGHRASLGTTSFFWTAYGFQSSAEAPLLARSLELFGNMLLHARIERHMERERAVIEGEYRRKFPTDIAYELRERLYRTVFPNTFFARMLSPLGTLESIRAMGEDDLQAFYDTNYVPENMEVIAVGELTLPEVVRFLEQSPFVAAKQGSRSSAIIPLAETPLPLENNERFKLGDYVHGMATAEYVSLAQLPDIFSQAQLGVVYRMLRERLFTEVREKRSWAYAISCGHSDFGGDFRQFAINCDGLRLDAIDEIEDVVTACIDSLPEQRELFEQAKASGIAFKRFGDPSAAQVADGALGDLFTKARIVTLSEEISKVEQLTINDVALITERLSSERRFTSIRVP